MSNEMARGAACVMHGGADHEALYAAERAAFDGTDLERRRPLAELRTLVEDVTSGDWWPGPRVAVEAARADAELSRAVETSSGIRVRLAAPQLTVATMAHELAHALAGIEARHGTVYRRALLDVVEVVTNHDPTDRRLLLHVDQLSQAFTDAGLTASERRWPPPPQSVSGPIAL